MSCKKCHQSQVTSPPLTHRNSGLDWKTKSSLINQNCECRHEKIKLPFSDMANDKSIPNYYYPSAASSSVSISSDCSKYDLCHQKINMYLILIRVKQELSYSWTKYSIQVHSVSNLNTTDYRCSQLTPRKRKEADTFENDTISAIQSTKTETEGEVRKQPLENKPSGKLRELANIFDVVKRDCSSTIR